jgi:hypothetical protein
MADDRYRDRASTDDLADAGTAGAPASAEPRVAAAAEKVNVSC